MPGVDVGHHLAGLQGSWPLVLSVSDRRYFQPRIVGYEVYEEENDEQGAALLHRTVLGERC
ncbi:hypothetical protein ACFOGG_15045 [Brenneria rubrifaciens]|uniref:hypothetical protein n=1 Tax=Brenneria rubrifaciens TaxID=55213 RepID=UPI0026D191A6